jgi:antitoxin MazE
MTTKLSLQDCGDYFALQIPKNLIQAAGMSSGNPVDVTLTEDKRIVVTSVATLASLVSRISPQNVHVETDWGAEVGKEVL